MESILHLYLIFRDICLPIVAMFGLGWGLDRLFQLHLDTLVKLNLYVFVPAFIFVKVTQSQVPGRQGSLIIGFTLLMIASMALISGLTAHFTQTPPKSRIALQMSTMFYNCGNFGLPLTALAYPEVGPGIQVFVLMTMNLSTFSIGLWMAHAQGENSVREGIHRWLPLLKSPPLYAIACAWIFKSFHIPIESAAFIWKPLTYLSEALISFALLTLGIQLSKTRPPRIQGHLTSALIIRLFGGPLVAILLVKAFQFPPAIAKVLVLGTAAPTAINTALIVHEFQGDTRFATATVFYSTLLSVLTVTLLLAFLEHPFIPWLR